MPDVLDMCKLLACESAWGAGVCASQRKELEVFNASRVLCESSRHVFC